MPLQLIQKLLPGAYPLSPMQQGMLFHWLQDDHAGVDIEQIVCSLREEIDPSLLRRAWEAVVERHTILRSSFRWEDVDEPLQVVHSNVLLPFTEQNWEDSTADQQDKKLKGLVAQDRRTDFALDTAPLMRFNLIKLGPRDFRLLWTSHHALLDGRSFPLLLQEVFAIYEAEQEGHAVRLPEPKPYREFIEWHQQKDFAVSRSYWQPLLRGFAHPTPFAVDRDLSCGESGERRYNEQEIKLSSEDTAALKNFAAANGLTMNTLVQAAWAILLSRYSGEEDVVFGGTRACRATALPGAESMAGIFINTLPVRTSVLPEQPLLPWLQSLRAGWKALREHEHTPLSLIQNWSDITPGSPLFESIVVFENFLLNTRMRSLGGRWTNREFKYYGQTNFPITVMGYLDTELLLIIGYDQRRFADDVVTRMLGHLQTLLTSMPRHAEKRICALSMLTSEERTSLVEDRNQTREFSVKCCIHQLFEERARRTPERIAVVYEQQRLTYEELDQRANQLTHCLRACGVKPETLVALCLERSIGLVVAILAVLKAGGAYLPLDLAYPPDRLSFMLEDAQVNLLITQDALLDKIPRCPDLRVVSLDQERERITMESSGRCESGVSPDDVAYVIYTSGSTGKPKGVLVTHANVVRLFLATEEWYHFNETDIWTLFHSYAFDFSVWEIWGALIYGGKLVVVPYLVSRSPENFYQLLCAERVTVLNQTPSAFHQLIQLEEAANSAGDLALRYMIFGGEALELQSLNPWFDRHGDRHPLLVNMYGITETTVHVTYQPLSKADLRGAPGSVIGERIPDLELYVLDAQLQPVPVGVVGEIYVGGAGLSRGYLRRDQLTAERFISHPFKPQSAERLYKTGDLGRWLPGSDLEYIGRADDQVKIRGFRIELGEIESVLCQHPAVQKAVVIAVRGNSGAKRLLAYLVATCGQSASITALRDFLKQKMPEYMVPAAFVWLERIPLTPNGKIDRKALPDPEPERPDLGSSYIEPRNPTEQALARIWSDVLHLERVGVEDNFFALGGDSILSIQIVSRARRAGLNLKPHHLLEHPTIAQLAPLAGANSCNHEEKVVSGEVPLTPIQHWFFEQNLSELNHYNQAFIFELGEKLERNVLERALLALSSHHDALRFRYTQTANGYKQFYAASEAELPLVWKDFANLTEAEEQGVIETACNAAQASLNLASGPLWRVVYFRMGLARPDRILFVIHHLAVDGVSWKPLLEDFETAFQQAKNGRAIQLPPKSTSYAQWARRLVDLANSAQLQGELPVWKEYLESNGFQNSTWTGTSTTSADHTEGSAKTLKLALSTAETQALLQKVNRTYNTQINDVLLTAVGRAFARVTGAVELVTNVEGHGREDLFEDVDLTRTVGWFTSIYPICLRTPFKDDVWNRGEALKFVKEQLRKIPQRGIGYGILRYLTPGRRLTAGEPSILFNYFGQLDHLVADSKLLRFAGESSGTWHSAKQQRRYALEINSAVSAGRFEVSWTYNEPFLSTRTVEQLAEKSRTALIELIEHCLSAEHRSYTPSDFPLARLEQASLERITAGCGEIEDIYPLSPMQSLFFVSSAGATQMMFDQWHCSLRGELDVSAFKRAWAATLKRHSVLRSSFHSAGLPQLHQIVHANVELPWSIADWRDMSPEKQEERWNTYLQDDRLRPLPLEQAPVMRFALIHLRDDFYKFLWTASPLLLDGWSWPVVFRAVSLLYDSIVSGSQGMSEPASPYRVYLQWLSQQRSSDAENFWSDYLKGFTEPTALPTDTPGKQSGETHYPRVPVRLTKETAESLSALARSTQVTPSAVVQCAWAMLLSQQSSRADVVFGSALAGRPTDIPGVENIVGPFVNNLPLRLRVEPEMPVGDLLRQIHAQILQVSRFQFTPLMEVQHCSKVPWHYRLFDSLLVFQNYQVDASATRFGRVQITELEGPIHTNFPLTILAEPRHGLAVTLIYDARRLSRLTVERWARDLALLFESIPSALQGTVGEMQAGLSAPVREQIRAGISDRTSSVTFIPPQTDLESSIAEIWQQLFGLEKVSTEENFFELGSHSLLLVQLHSRLQDRLKCALPIVDLFQYPTIRLLAAHLSQSQHAGSTTPAWRDRAHQQRNALARMRDALKK